MSKTPPRDLTRNLLKEFLPNERAIRAFEQLFKNTNTLFPNDVDLINSAINEVNVSAVSSELKINALYALIKSLADDVDFVLTQPQKPSVIDETQPWTPIFGGSTSQSGQAYSTQVGKILTIGRFNFASFDVQLSTLGTITGNLQIKGLPSNAIVFAAASVGAFANLNTAYVGLNLSMQANAGVIDVTGLTAAATSSGASLTSANLTATSRIAGSIAYIS